MKIAVILNHPDPSNERLCRALAMAYVKGATAAGHEANVIDIAALDLPLLQTMSEWHEGSDGTPDILKPA